MLMGPVDHLLVSFYETGSHYVVLAGLKLAYLDQACPAPQCWDKRVYTTPSRDQLFSLPVQGCVLGFFQDRVSLYFWLHKNSLCISAVSLAPRNINIY